MSQPEDDLLSDDDSASDADLPPEIALLWDCLPLAAVANEPELQLVQARARQLGAFFAATIQARSVSTARSHDVVERLADADAGGFARLADLPKQLGDFEIFERVDIGGMGAVYRAWQRSTGRAVAIKIIAPHRQDSVEAQRRFRREGQLALGLRHPHLVEVLAAGEEAGRAYLAMEFLAGSDLARVAAGQGPLAVADACELIRQAALGVDFLNQQGFVHRDLKPSNLMLSGTPATVKVLDLGLVHDAGETALSELTQSRQILGTYDYLAPEQARDSRAVDGRADIYSLGCTLYRLLAGFAPFSRVGGGSPATILIAHQLDTARPLNSLRPEIPVELAAVVARAMAKQPAERFATAGELANALVVFSAGAKLDRLLELTEGHSGRDVAADQVSAVQVAADQVAAVAGSMANEPTGVTASSDSDRTSASEPATEGVRADRDGAHFRGGRSWRVGGAMAGGVAGVAVLALFLMAWTGLGPGRNRARREAIAPGAAGKGIVGKGASRSQGEPSAGVRVVSHPPPLLAPFTAAEAQAAQHEWARRLKLADVEIANTIGMPLRLVPPGEFHSRSRVRGARASRPLFFGAHEVTEREFARVMKSDKAEVVKAETADWPARGVAWHEAIEFCRRLSDLPEERRAGRRYSLPPHADWEWACRAGVESDMPWNVSTMRDHAVANEPAPRPVGSFPANPFGLVDMRGNIAEWMAEWLPELASAPMTPPSSPQPQLASTPFVRPVVRGGSYESEAADLLRATATRWHFPESPPKPDCGFRVVCWLTEWTPPQLAASEQASDGRSSNVVPSRSRQPSTARRTDLPRLETVFDPMIARDTALNGWGFPGGDVANVDGVLVETIGAGSEWGSVWYGRHGNLEDFELRCDMRVEGPLDECLVLFRANVLETSWDTGSHYRLHLAGDRAGWLYRSTPGGTDTIAVAPADLLARLRFDTWNPLAIRCEGRRVRIWLGGELAIDLTDTAPNVCLRGPLSFLFRGSPAGSRRTARFRDLRIAHLNAESNSDPKPMPWTMGQENLPQRASVRKR